MPRPPTTLINLEPLSVFDKISLAWRLPWFVGCCVANFASRLLSRDEASQLNWRQKLALAFLQASGAAFTAKQRAPGLRKPLTGTRIQDHCRKHNLELRTVSLDNATLGNERHVPVPVLHFVKPPTARSGGPTMLYSHGGGYHYPLRPQGHIPFAMLCAAVCKAEQVVFLEYSLAPEQQYPCQLIQAVAALRFLLEDEGISPENLIIGGDSAGGHLTASLLAHIAHPSPYAPPVDLRGAQFKAVLLISPWVELFAEKRMSNRREARNDYLSEQRISFFREQFSPSANEVWSDIYGADASATVWKTVFPGGSGRAVSRRALVAVGTSETLLDSCVKFGRERVGCKDVLVEAGTDLEVLKKEDLVLAVVPGEAHVQAAVDCAVKFYEGRMMRATLAFLESC